MKFHYFLICLYRSFILFIFNKSNKEEKAMSNNAMISAKAKELCCTVKNAFSNLSVMDLIQDDDLRLIWDTLNYAMRRAYEAKINRRTTSQTFVLKEIPRPQSPIKKTTTTTPPIRYSRKNLLNAYSLMPSRRVDMDPISLPIIPPFPNLCNGGMPLLMPGPSCTIPCLPFLPMDSTLTYTTPDENSIEVQFFLVERCSNLNGRLYEKWLVPGEMSPCMELVFINLLIQYSDRNWRSHTTITPPRGQPLSIDIAEKRYNMMPTKIKNIDAYCKKGIIKLKH